MNDRIAKCPRCGAHQLIASTIHRIVPLVPDNASRPSDPKTVAMVEETSTSYRCVCSWSGSLAELKA